MTTTRFIGALGLGRLPVHARHIRRIGHKNKAKAPEISAEATRKSAPSLIACRNADELPTQRIAPNQAPAHKSILTSKIFLLRYNF
ncbi:MAG: hypothetical protein JKX85_15620 [Phycisphaeraceae bacterium]|nr:hypothetical protein [Phycisphaeraceae bacterium]